MIEKIKKALDLTNQELTEKGIHKSQLTRWKKNGFHQSTELLFELLLEKIENGKIKSRPGAKRFRKTTANI